jgi:hypothetical protein
MMPSIQAIFAVVFCSVGALVLAVAHYQAKHHQIGKVRLISPRTSHAIGLVLLVIGGLMFAGQFVHRPPHFNPRRAERLIYVPANLGS